MISSQSCVLLTLPEAYSLEQKITFHYLNASWDQFEMMPSMGLYQLNCLYKDVVDPQKTRTGVPANWNYKLLEKHKEHISWMEILQAGWGYIFSWKRLMYEWKWEKSYQKNSGGQSFFIFHNKCSPTVLFSWELTSFCTSNW